MSVQSISAKYHRFLSRRSIISGRFYRDVSSDELMPVAEQTQRKIRQGSSLPRACEGKLSATVSALPVPRFYEVDLKGRKPYVPSEQEVVGL